MSDKVTSTANTTAPTAFVGETREATQHETKLATEEAAQEGLEEGRNELNQRAIEDAREVKRETAREVARKSPAELRRESIKRSPGQILLLLLIFLIAFLIAAATGRPDILGFPSSREIPAQPLATPVLSGDGQGQVVGQAGPRIYEVAPVFRPYYDQFNGAQIFGRPISDVVIVKGRESQWFERARLEHWPENRGTLYEFQPALVGVEFTQGIPFPNQAFFVSNPQLVYSPITNHGVSERFYQFWRQNGGLDIFGWPISEELQEYLSTTGQVHTVQYFERGRLEFHPENAGTTSEIMIGLLGRALYLEDSQPNIISAAKPTPVPVP
ncbi:MAG: hypothetical protein H7Z42_14025 [Roseiflexaceae bacterium]|nr:hypothetical protein [Roseiflexaceae bacterium]